MALEKTIDDNGKTITELKIDLRISARQVRDLEKKESTEKLEIEKYKAEVRFI